MPFDLSILYLFTMRFLAPLLLGFIVPLAAQSPAPTPPAEPASVPISPQDALAHRIGHNRPVYPRFAVAAGVTGTVKITVTISEDGLAGTNPVAGPPSLIPSAIAWIGNSKFRPFLRDSLPVSVTTTLPVVFQLPPGAHSAHPPAVLYPRNVTATIEREGPDTLRRARWSMLSPAMRDWLARYQPAIATLDDPGPIVTNMLPFDRVLARNNAAPLVQMPGNIALYPIPLPGPNHRLYVLFEFNHGCVQSNCPIFLLNETRTDVQIAIRQLGVEVDLHRRHDSPYPDLLFWSDVLRPANSGISRISGYGYYGGQWGQLYCGTDDANEDSERDEAIAERGVRHLVQRPLVSLCK